jgi:hypothetical protein
MVALNVRLQERYMCPVTRTVLKGNVEAAVLKPTYVSCKDWGPLAGEVECGVLETDSKSVQGASGDDGVCQADCTTRDERSYLRRVTDRERHHSSEAGKCDLTLGSHVLLYAVSHSA